MKKLKIMSLIAVMLVCSVAVIGVGYAAFTGNYTNNTNTSTVTESTHTVGIWSKSNNTYSLVANSQLVEDVTYELSSNTVNGVTTYSTAVQTLTVITDKYVFIDGSASASGISAGDVVMRIAGLDKDFIDADGIVVSINGVSMPGETFIENNAITWMGVLNLTSTAANCVLEVNVDTVAKQSYTLSSFDDITVDVGMLYSSEQAFIDRGMAKATSVTIPAGTTEYVAGAIAIPAHTNGSIAVTFGTALPEGAQVWVGGVQATSSNGTAFTCAAHDGGALKVILSEGSQAPIVSTISVAMAN